MLSNATASTGGTPSDRSSTCEDGDSTPTNCAETAVRAVSAFRGARFVGVEPPPYAIPYVPWFAHLGFVAFSSLAKAQLAGFF